MLQDISDINIQICLFNNKNKHICLNCLFPNKEDADLRLLEAICVQHEIDHLNGLTIFDRRYTPQPIICMVVKATWLHNFH